MSEVVSIDEYQAIVQFPSLRNGIPRVVEDRTTWKQISRRLSETNTEPETDREENVQNVTEQDFL